MFAGTRACTAEHSSAGRAHGHSAPGHGRRSPSRHPRRATIFLVHLRPRQARQAASPPQYPTPGRDQVRLSGADDGSRACSTLGQRAAAPWSRSRGSARTSGSISSRPPRGSQWHRSDLFAGLPKRPIRASRATVTSKVPTHRLADRRAPLFTSHRDPRPLSENWRSRNGHQAPWRCRCPAPKVGPAPPGRARPAACLSPASPPPGRSRGNRRFDSARGWPLARRNPA